MKALQDGFSGFSRVIRTSRLKSLFGVVSVVVVASCGGSVLPLAHAGQVIVNTYDDLRSMVANQPAGTTFVIKAGVHRLQSAVPKDGDVFTGETGAILSGAQLLTSFQRSGSYWAAPVRATQAPSYRGECFSWAPACKYPEDLFFNQHPLQRVASLAQVQAGKWFLDYHYGLAYFADDPAGKAVEISLLPYAFASSAQKVVIKNLTVEKYASQASAGAIHGMDGWGNLSSGWVVQYNNIRLNHGMGIRLGNYMSVLNNNIHQNGQMGLGGGGTSTLVESNEIAYNNYACYSFGWEAGGTKFAYTKNLVVRRNYVHENFGPGLWTDIENQNALYELNYTAGNRVAGILHEISYAAVIRYNTIVNEGKAFPGQTTIWYGAGILVSNSSNVQVYGNTVKYCSNGIGGIQVNRGNSSSGTPYQTRNLSVHDNYIVQGVGQAEGIVKASYLDDSVFTSWNNHFQNEKFSLSNSSGMYFAWLNQLWNYNQWINYSSIH